MSILFMMPTWSAPSELWIQRMLESLEPHLGLIACRQPKPTWRGRIPTLALTGRGDDHSLVSEAIAARGISSVFVHYLPFALRYRAVWDRTDVPVFAHGHGYDVTWDRRHPDGRRFHAPGYEQQVRDLAARVMLVANSQRTAERLRAIDVPDDRIVIKYLGVPVPAEPPTRPERTTGLTVLYLGRLVDFKGPDRTIEAFDLACRNGLDATLLVAGDGPLRERCEALVRTLPHGDRVRLLGPVEHDEGERLRAASDIFTAHNQMGPDTGQEEAFGVSIVEAMASALPVVTGRSGAFPEVIDSDRDGILFEPGDVAQHAAVLGHLGEHPEERRRLGGAAWRTVRERFSVEREARALRELLVNPIAA